MIMVLGAGGMLGRGLVHQLSTSGYPFVAFTHQEFDVRSETVFKKLLKQHKPTAVINCAAATNVDWCEQNRSLAFEINADANRHLAAQCYDRKIRFFYISTDYVFDGEDEGPYIEVDGVNPIQVYGQSKLAGEEIALEHGGTSIRIQWVYGLGKNNFVDWVIRSALDGKPVQIIKEQMGSPSSTAWLSSMLHLMIHKLTTPELYHLAHDNWCSRLDAAEFIVRGLGKNPEELIQIKAMDQFGIAKRPVSTILGNSKLKDVLGLKTLGTWEMDLKSHITTNWKLPFYL